MDQRRRALVDENLPLVEQVVLRVARGFPRFVDRSELIGAGMLGLVEAAHRYDFDRAVPFAAYASQRIRGAVLDVARGADWSPRSVREQARQVDEASNRLANRHGTPPAEEAIAVETGMSVDELRQLRERVRYGVLRALDQQAPGDGTSERDMIWDRSASGPEEMIEAAELRGYLRSALQSLPERHRIVIVGIYLESRSFEELADLLGVTTSRVSQLRADAVEMLREGIEAQFRPSRTERPKGRVEIRKALFAAEVAAHADWRTRLDPSRINLPVVTPAASNLRAAAGYDA
jgi:RNA polymerase sigma factor for flagellar operon FliA